MCPYLFHPICCLRGRHLCHAWFLFVWNLCKLLPSTHISILVVYTIDLLINLFIRFTKITLIFLPLYLLQSVIASTEQPNGVGLSPTYAMSKNCSAYEKNCIVRLLVGRHSTCWIANCPLLTSDVKSGEKNDSQPYVCASAYGLASPRLIRLKKPWILKESRPPPCSYPGPFYKICIG